MRRYLVLIFLLLGTTPSLAAPPALRVGVADGAAPCNFQDRGAWKGIAVELWRAVANREQLAYQLVPKATTKDLLAAVRNSEVDLAIGCLTMTPGRLGIYRFSQTYQESGQAVMVKRDPMELGRSMLKSLISVDLLTLLFGFMAIFIVMALGVWNTDSWGTKEETIKNGRLRSFVKVFQILATGPGTNTIVDSFGGNGLVVLSYLLRALMASFLVSYVTINIIRNPSNLQVASIGSLADFKNQKLAVRIGSSSQSLLQEILRDKPSLAIKIVPMNGIDQAPLMLESGRASAILADDIQLNYLINNLKENKFRIVLHDLEPGYQGFIFSKKLEPSIAGSINESIVEFRRSGLLQGLKESWGIVQAENSD
jgi:ABC-type amino acid transport substrate-binding protein